MAGPLKPFPPPPLELNGSRNYITKKDVQTMFKKALKEGEGYLLRLL